MHGLNVQLWPLMAWLQAPLAYGAQGNAIRSIRGLHQLTLLTELDLRCNLLASYQEFSQLKGTRPPQGGPGE